MEIVYLSHHFSENTYLVAGKCSKCYMECEDLRIIGVNSIFLRNYKISEYIKGSKILNQFDFNRDFFVYLDDFKPNSIKKYDPNDTINTTINIKKHEPKFIPPKSPYKLIEEELYDDPWKLLIATIFLNKTSLRTSRDHLDYFFYTFRNPETLLQTEIAKLEKHFEPLGLKSTRAVQVYYMTHDYLFKNWKKVEEIYGIGEYGRDAYNMFCVGNFDVEPKDRYLRIYRNWYQKVYLQKDEEFAEKFYNAVSQKDRCEDDVQKDL